MKKKKLLIIIPVGMILLIIIILKTLPLGYDIESMIYDRTDGSQTVELGVPKLSFLKKENDRSYSYKNIRGNKIL